MTELTLKQIALIVRRWWWILLLGLIAGIGAGWFLANRTEPVYQADAKLLVDRPTLATTSETPSGAYNNILAAERLTQTFGQLVETRIVLTSALERMGDAAGDLTVEDLESALTVTVVPDTQIIQVEVTDSSPDRAALILNSISEAFIIEAASVRPDVSSDNTDALQQSIDEIVEDMALTQDQIDDLEAGQDASTAAVQAQLRELRTLLGEYQSRHAELVEIQQRMTISAAETGVLVKVVDPAIASDTPISSNPVFTMFLGLLGGLGIAGAIVFILGYLDNTVKDPSMAQHITGRSTLGSVPFTKSTDLSEGLTAMARQPAEAYRTLRTNLQFATVGRPVRSMVVTAARPGDGSTTTAAHLATVLAQGGQQVVLVDADLRAPSIHQLAGHPNRSGLTNLLLGDSLDDIDEYLHRTEVERLQILTAGPLPPNPADVLNSQRMEELVQHLEMRADLVIFDCPSLQYADALILISMTSGSLIVASANKTRSNELADAVAAIEHTGKPIFGTVLNRVKASKKSKHPPSHLVNQPAGTDGRSPEGKSRRKRRRIRRLPGLLSR